MDKPKIWLDVDGVLLDYTNAFLEFSGINATYDGLTEYDLTKFFDSPEDCYAKMREFSASYPFAYLEPQEAGLKTQLELLKNVGYSLNIITQLDADPEDKVRRVMNLTKQFGPVFDDMVFTQRGQCKLDYLLKESSKPFVLVDDNPTLLLKAERHIANDMRKSGGTSVRVFARSHAYNIDALFELEHVTLVPDMKTVTQFLMHEAVA